MILIVMFTHFCTPLATKLTATGPAFKITDIARALIKHYTGDENSIELKTVGIRKGEKLHEEMISAEEWMRTEEHDHYLISDDIIHDECVSYNSYDSVMPGEQVYDFLKSTKVI